MKPKLWIAVLLSTSLSPLLCHGQDVPQPQQLIQAANSATDLSKLRPYTLKARIVVRSGTSEEKSGSLTIFQDKDRSRIELEFENYSELRIVIGNRAYVSRNSQAPQMELPTTEEIPGLWRVDIHSLDEIGHSFVKQANGTQASCFDVTRPHAVDVRNPAWTTPSDIVTDCFDPDTKVLLFTSTRREKEKPFSEVHYINYQSVGGVQFPSAIRRFVLGKPSGVDFEDIRLSSLNPDSALFSPPKDAVAGETCENLRLGRLLKKADPYYPQMAKIAHVQGEVYVSARIGKDGKLQNVRVISGSPILVPAVLDAIKYWEYSPYMCNAGPVEVETTLTFKFHMGR